LNEVPYIIEVGPMAHGNQKILQQPGCGN